MKNRIVWIVMFAMLLAFQGGALAESRVVDMEFRDADVLDVFQILGELGGLNVLADRSVEGEVSFFLKSMPVMDAIDLVARTSGYRYKVEKNNTLVIASEDRLEREFTDEKVVLIQPKYLSATKAREIVGLTLESGKVVVDENTGTLIIRGAEDRLGEIQNILEKFDVPLALEFDFVNTPVADVLRQLAKAGGYNILIGNGVQGNLTMYLKDMAIADAFDIVARSAGIEYHITPDGLMNFGMSASTDGGTAVQLAKPATSPVQMNMIEVRYLQAETLKQLIQAVLPAIQIDADNKTGVFVMRGTPEQLEQAKLIIRQKDVPQIRVTGVVKRGEERLAILEINGKSQVVKENDLIVAEFLVEKIGDKEVIISRGDSRDVLPVGGVK